ncbi:MAG: 23S rRNA (guanosine(2251)-2'-O)-methyltransferase RlmB [Candidatus Limnocylindrales bacterium]
MVRRPRPYPGSRPGGPPGPRHAGPGPRPGGPAAHRTEGGAPGFGRGPRPGRAGFGFGAGRPQEARGEPEAEESAGPTQPEFEAPEATETGDATLRPDSVPAEAEGPAFGRVPRSASHRPDYRARSGGFVDRRPFGAGGPSAAPWTRTPAGPPAGDLLAEGEELIAGRHPVEEAFIAHRKAIRLLVVPQRRQALEKLVFHATNLRIPIVEVEGGTLTSLAGFDGHQGIALVTDRRQYAGLDDILARAIERKEAPFVLVLDSLEDPQNFGSLLRTAEASGVHGVIYPVRHQAPLSAAAIKASAGAVEHLLLVPVEDLADALTDLHVRGLRIIGSDADASLTARQADLRGPAVVVVGSEGQGLGPAVRRRCDTVVRIPMRGRVASLNAAVAGSILLYEASSQRGGERPLIGPEPGTESRLEVAADAATPADVATPAEAELAPKRRRRAAAKQEPADLSAETEEDTLLPGSSAIDSNDAATDD